MLTQHINELQQDLVGLLDHRETLNALSEAVLTAFNNGRKLLTCGNGGSAAEAAHLAEEFTGRFYRERRSLPGLCLSIDGTLLTCIGNDYGFDEIFARQIHSLGMPGDVLIAATRRTFCGRWRRPKSVALSRACSRAKPAASAGARPITRFACRV